jgi:regulator of RNase E activity RraA
MALMTPVYNVSETVSTSDATNFSQFTTNNRLTDAIYVAGAGTVTVVYQDGRTQQFTAIAGAMLPVAAKRVNATGTAATGMVALYQF